MSLQFGASGLGLGVQGYWVQCLRRLVSFAFICLGFSFFLQRLWFRV